jgi:hypothetical protein
MKRAIVTGKNLFVGINFMDPFDSNLKAVVKANGIREGWAIGAADTSDWTEPTCPVVMQSYQSSVIRSRSFLSF